MKTIALECMEIMAQVQSIRRKRGQNFSRDPPIPSYPVLYYSRRLLRDEGPHTVLHLDMQFIGRQRQPEDCDVGLAKGQRKQRIEERLRCGSCEGSENIEARDADHRGHKR
ncbi:hypothetical protein J6590_059678 [Homalodisca vitripennis]|nr:hypothetical protein J6590_059678 [Homalodisca vitripennis]